MMETGDEIEDGWKVVKEMVTATGTGYVVSRPYSKEYWAKKGVKEYAIITEGAFRISTRQQCEFITLILENIKGDNSRAFDMEKKKYTDTLEKIKFYG